MKRIFYPGGSVVTGSDLADAVLLYAEALCNRRQVDVVDIPVMGDEGRLLRAQFLLGSASQLMSVTAESLSPELIFNALVECEDSYPALLAELRLALARALGVDPATFSGMSSRAANL